MSLDLRLSVVIEPDLFNLKLYRDSILENGKHKHCPTLCRLTDFGNKYLTELCSNVNVNKNNMLV